MARVARVARVARESPPPVMIAFAAVALIAVGLGRRAAFRPSP
jgi:hypothetical protein